MTSTKTVKKLLIVSRASQRHLTAIGHVIVNWAAVEDLLEELIVQLFAQNQIKGRIILAQMDYRHKKNALLAACELLPEGDLGGDKLRELLPQLNAAYGLRSTVAHSFWTKGRKPGSIKPMRFEARGSIKMRGHQPNEPNHTAQSLHREATNIGILYRELSKLVRWKRP